MNIFATSEMYRLACRDLDDLRLGKMVLETAQLVSTALRIRFNIDTYYRSTHINHPCNIWARESMGNLRWLIRYGQSLHDEFISRKGKCHKSGLVLDQMWDTYNKIVETHDDAFEPMTPFANCARRKDMNLDFTHLPVHAAYRAYLNARWALDKKRPKWTNTNPPTWANYIWQGE